MLRFFPVLLIALTIAGVSWGDIEGEEDQRPSPLLHIRPVPPPGEPRDYYELAEPWLTAFNAGEAEFQRVWTPTQGRGPFWNAGACSQCHFTQNGLGGYGTTATVTFYGFSGIGTGGESLFFPAQGLVLRANSNSPDPVEVMPAWANAETERRTPQMMGLGLVEAVPDQVFHQLAAANGGKVVVSPETGRVQRWGQQNQFATVKEFVDAAYVNELGVTPEEAAAAVFPVPDEVPIPNRAELVWQYLLLLDHPEEYVAPAIEEDVELGEELFDIIGCDDCHTPTLTTGPGPLVVNGMTLDIESLKNRVFHPYSDYLLHDLEFESDPVHLGQASGSEYRTAPLWGRRYERTDLFHDNSTLRGDFSTSIDRHGGEASSSRAIYQALDTVYQDAIKQFVITR